MIPFHSFKHPDSIHTTLITRYRSTDVHIAQVIVCCVDSHNFCFIYGRDLYFCHPLTTFSGNATYPYPHPKTVEPYLIGILASDQDAQPCEPYPHGSCDPDHPPTPKLTPYQGPLNHLVVIKRNRIMNNGGIEVRGHTTNVIVENNEITNSSVGVHDAKDHTSHVFFNGNTHIGWR